KLGYYSLPETEAWRLKRFFRFPSEQFLALDPCSGTGAALQAHIAFLVGAQEPSSQIVGIGLRQLLFRAIATAVMLCQDLL
ncbi:MAG: hypothetical protein ACK5ZU_19215, partial [Acidobacteriota bacterium]